MDKNLYNALKMYSEFKFNKKDLYELVEKYINKENVFDIFHSLICAEITRAVTVDPKLLKQIK
jgi:hypothetical protein